MNGDKILSSLLREDGKIYCDKCNACLTENGKHMVGHVLTLELFPDYDHIEIERVKMKYGRTTFGICFICLLTVYGVKEREVKI